MKYTVYYLTINVNKYFSFNQFTIISKGTISSILVIHRLDTMSQLLQWRHSGFKIDG